MSAATRAAGNAHRLAQSGAGAVSGASRETGTPRGAPRARSATFAPFATRHELENVTVTLVCCACGTSTVGPVSNWTLQALVGAGAVDATERRSLRSVVLVRPM